MRFEKDIILYISQEIFEHLRKCVQNSAPNEAFGLILGPKPNEIELTNPGEFQYQYLAEIFECIESDRSSPVDFLMENVEELYQIIRNAKEKYNRRVLSIFHSHPAGANPSGFDINYMKLLNSFHETVLNSPVMMKTAFKNQIWTIMDGENYNINGFIYLEEEVQQIQLKIV
ncbi:MAG: Mov34/MPN/PAD-1 family protein [Promethearchaeota archaeon]|jgi:proteasome lid subunit RPN8/RPN11